MHLYTMNCEPQKKRKSKHVHPVQTTYKKINEIPLAS